VSGRGETDPEKIARSATRGRQPEEILCRHCRRPIQRTAGSHGYWYHDDGEVACEPAKGTTGSTAAAPGRSRPR